MIRKISKYTVALFLALIIVWTIGFLIINNTQYLTSPILIWLAGVLNTIMACGIFLIFAVLLYLIFRKIKIEKVVIHFVFSLILLIEILSLFYFSITLEPLGASIFQFSSKQADLILKSYFIFKWYYLLTPIPIIFYFLFVFKIKLKYERLIFYFFILASVLIFFNAEIKIGSESFKNLAPNKTIYFFKSFFKQNHNEVYSLNPKMVAFYQKAVNPFLKDKTYPLYRPSYTTDPLAPFFNLKETPPNIMIIIVESLSASYSGPRADEISYTPFLDSLAKHSLYFDNILATAQRSFAALPSILGSLPQGRSGFTDTKGGYPDNYTLPKWLFKNGYTGSFHYGGYARFDFMDLFMNNQGFSNIYSRDQYSYKGTGLKTSIDSIPFGIPDSLMFQQSLAHLKNRKNLPPYLDVYFTLSTHYPFMIPNHEAYYKKTRAIIAKANVSNEIKEKNKHYIPELASFLYLDNSLRYFFAKQKKTKAYQNTIYIIVGDHMMGDIPQSNPIEKYRPTMLIYSPLLKRHKVIRGVNSHLDISPSIYQLIQQKYQYKKIDSVAWLGQPFDTTSNFECNRNVLFMLNDRKVEDILHGAYFYHKGNVFKVGDRLKLTEINNDKISDSLKKLLGVSTEIHAQVVTQNRLIPPLQETQLIFEINKQLTINDKLEFINILDYKLKDNPKEILFDLNMKFNGDWEVTPEDKRPLLIYNIKRGDSSLMWGKVNMRFEQYKMENDRTIHFRLQNNLNLEMKKGDEVSVYFWNYKQPKGKNFEAIIHPLTLKERN